MSAGPHPQANPHPRTGPPRAPVLYAVWFGVPASAAEEFEAWYREEHIPLLLML